MLLKKFQKIKILKEIRDSLGKKRPQIRTNCIFPSIYKNANEYKDYMYSIESRLGYC